MAQWIDEERDEGVFTPTKGHMLNIGKKTISIVSARCSECGKCCEEIDNFPPYMHYKFCPRCGAEME